MRVGVKKSDFGLIDLIDRPLGSRIRKGYVGSIDTTGRAMDDTPFEAADRHVLDPGCDRCPALVASRTEIAWGNGPADADVMVVGEAPAAGDPSADRWRGGNLTGYAYTSRHSGRRIRRFMAAIGYPDAYYTNAVKCFPAEEDRSDPDDIDRSNQDENGPSNREPTDEELSNCRSHLLSEVELVDPETIVTTGKHATRTVFSIEGWRLDGFLDRVLDSIECPRLGVRLVPILHPSYQDIWRSRLGYTAEEYREAAATVIGGGPPPNSGP